MRKPAAFSFTNLAMPAVEAWARWAVPNASFTQTSARPASSFAKFSSSFSSSGWKRRFSRSRTWPSFRSFTSFFTPSPTQSSARITSCRSSSDRRAAAGSRVSFVRSSGLPFGRPRCDARMTRACACTAYRIVGSAARIRASSVTRPCSSRGTLKSTRMKTRFPASSRASMVFSMTRSLGQVLGHVDHAVREAPLVVVPGEDLGEGAVDDERARRVEDRRRRVVVVVHRDRGRLGVREDALQRSLRGLLERRVDLLGGRRLLELDREVDERDVRRRDAYRRAVELPLERGDHLRDRLRGPGRRGDHRQRGGARAVKRPVHSRTRSALFAAWGRSAGDFVAVTWISFPLTTIPFSVAFTSAARTPWTESYLRRWARVFVSVRSLIETNSRSFSPRSIAARTMHRPIRPKPLIAIRAIVFPPRVRVRVRGRKEAPKLPSDPGGVNGNAGAASRQKHGGADRSAPPGPFALARS